MTEPQRYTHLAFADESRHNVGRFRRDFVVSLNADCFDEVSTTLDQLRIESKVKEVHWKELTGAKVRFCASKWVTESPFFAAKGLGDRTSRSSTPTKHRSNSLDDV
jgi:hypothetical protein